MTKPETESPTVPTAQAAAPTMAEIVARLERETTAEYSISDILAAIDEGRAGR